MPAPRAPRPTSLPLAAALAALLLASAPGRVQAAHPLLTDDVGTVGVSAVEVELSVQGGREGDATPDHHVDLGLALRLGLLDRLDTGVTVIFETSGAGGEGWQGDMAAPVLDLKWRFTDADGGAPGLALRLDYEPATGDLGHHGAGHTLGALLLASWEPGALAVHLNLGSFAHGLGSDLTWHLHASGTALLRVAPSLFVGVEGVTELDPAAGELQTTSALAALQWDLGEGRVASLGAGPVWSPDHGTGWLATAGYTVAFAAD